MPDAEVRLTAHTGDARAPSSIATLHQDAQNKLLQSAVVDMPTSGVWLLDIFVRRGRENADMSMSLNVVNPEGRRENRWPYGVVVAFFAILVLIHRLRHAADAKCITRSARDDEFVNLFPPL